ncbi:MAG: M48 family metalloprotease [Pyrinomonadaceae bacterium]
MFQHDAHRIAPALGAALLFALTFTARAQAPTQPQTPQRDMQKEARLWEELKAISPGSVETFKQATEAMDRGDHETAARLYQEVIKRVPDWDVANRRLGYALVATGKKDDGLTRLRRAVALKNSPDNLLGLAQTLAYPDEQTQGSAAEKQEARALAEEAFRLNTDASDPSYALLLGQLSLEANALADFRTATQSLSEHHPELMPTHYFSAILAASDENWSKADSEIKRAGQMGLPPAEVESFLSESGVSTHLLAWRSIYVALGVLTLWALGIAFMFVLGKALSRRTLRHLETADPNAPVGEAEHRLRRLYRAVINVAGLYYYVSLPIVIVLVLGVTAGVIYGFMMLGWLPIKLIIVLTCGALVTVYQMIRSLFVRHKQEDPGRALAEREAPGLWTMAREVAGAVGTRPINEIRVTPGTEVAVYERGTLRARMKDDAERVLLIGVGVLNGFRQDAFRAVLAHEYGHFINRDTAGGDIALRVKTDMLNFARGIIASRQNTRWNLGFHFLRLYYKIFTAISHGAGRLQEVLADRLAARHYGAAAFREGLIHVVRRSISFEQVVNEEIRSATGARRAPANLYELPDPQMSAQQRTLEEEFDRAINRETADTDTHPSPTERFRLIEHVLSRDVPAAPGDVWELFADRHALTSEMSASVASRLRSA